MADTTTMQGGAPPGAPARPMLDLEFCGHRQPITADRFRLGARADLNLDDPSALPDELVELVLVEGVWLVRALAAGPTVTLRDESGRWTAGVTVSGAVPLVFAAHALSIIADRGTYEVELRLGNPLFRSASSDQPTIIHHGGPGSATMPTGTGGGRSELDRPVNLNLSLNREQRVLLAVLAAPVLRGGPLALSEIPSSVEAARLLDWPVTKFNRKLDTVCGKLARAGVTGLHGGANRPALNRRTRLVQTVVDADVVTVADLALLAEYGVTGG